MYTCIEPASPGPDSDTTMDTMEVDSSDMEGGRGLDDPEEPSTPEDRMFDMDSPFLDREKDEEPIKMIRCEDADVKRYCTLKCVVQLSNYIKCFLMKYINAAFNLTFMTKK